MSTDAPSSSTAANSAAVQALYGAFGRGDIPAILELLADDVRWEHWGDSFAQRADVPWMKARTGREEVTGFFAVVGAFEITEFSVRDLMASENQVTAEIVIEVGLPDGGRYRDEELHLWSFDADGKVRALRHYTDTAKQIAAARGEDTTSG
jgi:ketosteroid isomerase-like protein